MCSGTNPAARMFCDTMDLASTAPWEWRASNVGERVALEDLRPRNVEEVGEVLTGDVPAEPASTGLVGSICAVCITESVAARG